MSEGLAQRFLSGIGVVISTGQINQIILSNSRKLVAGYTHLRTWGIKTSQYLHSDATGFTRQVIGTGNRLRHHLLGHQYFSLFKVTSRYNSLVLSTQVLGNNGLRTPYISDDASANGSKLVITRKQLCWVHEIRHYTKLSPVCNHHKHQTDEVINQLWEWYNRAKQYTSDFNTPTKRQLSDQFDQIMARESSYDQLNKRLLLTQRKRDRLLCFLNHPGLPIQNNQAERDLRPAVILRKLSGGTKSVAGDKSFERHLSIIQTAHKQGLNVFEVIHGLIMGSFDPFLLTRKKLPALATI